MIGRRAKYLMLEDSGYDVEIAFFDFKENGMEIDFHVSKSATDALDYLFTEDGSFKGDPPEAIFVDLYMPKISGLEFLRILKSNQQSNQIPIVVLLSSENQRELDECKRLGVKRFVQKPLEYEKFVSAIKDINK